jgi:hypothetical protein
MEPYAIVERARVLGVKLSVAGDRIRYAPKSRTPADLVEALRKNKCDLLLYLRKKPEDTTYENRNLLAWASYLAEQDLMFTEPVSYVEAPLRTVTTSRVSWYAARYLASITYARLQQQNGGWGIFTSRWWQDRENEALNALCNLRKVLTSIEVRQ